MPLTSIEPISAPCALPVGRPLAPRPRTSPRPVVTVTGNARPCSSQGPTGSPQPDHAHRWPLRVLAPVTPHRNARVCMSEAERVQMAWRFASLWCSPAGPPKRPAPGPQPDRRCLDPLAAARTACSTSLAACAAPESQTACLGWFAGVGRGRVGLGSRRCPAADVAGDRLAQGGRIDERSQVAQAGEVRVSACGNIAAKLAAFSQSHGRMQPPVMTRVGAVTRAGRAERPDGEGRIS